MSNLQAKEARGFTLIELLVVIAIIGLLSSIILASLGTARAKAADATIKENLFSIRTQAELLYDQSRNCYGDGGDNDCNTNSLSAQACPTAAPSITDETILENVQIQTALIKSGDLSSGQGMNGAYCLTTAGQTAWAISVPYKSDNNLGWCVDSTGKSKEVTMDIGNNDYGFSGNQCQ